VRKDGSIAVEAETKRREVNLWQPTNPKARDFRLVTIGKAYRSSPLGLACTADGQRLASAGMDGTITLWDAATGQEVMTLRGHGAAVTAVTFGPDGNRLVSGSMDGDARIWDATPLPGQPD
jgi:WD40 repeat protein